MRRALLFLALLLAGSWGDRAAPPPPPAAELHQLASAAGSSPLAFLRTGYSHALLAWQDAPESARSPWSRRGPSERPGSDLDTVTARGVHAAFVTHGRAHSGHAARFALLRAGHLSFHTATPPPFRSA